VISETNKLKEEINTKQLELEEKLNKLIEKKKTEVVDNKES